MITRQTETVRLTTDDSIRCERCHKLLAERATRPWRIACVRCGHVNHRLARHPAPAPEQPAPPAPHQSLQSEIAAARTTRPRPRIAPATKAKAKAKRRKT